MATQEQIEAARRELARRELTKREQTTPERGSATIGSTAADIGSRFLGTGETLLSMATGAASEIPAGLGGILASVVPGGRDGPSAVRNIQQMFTYEPRTNFGREHAQATARMVAPVERGADLAGELSGDPEDTLGATAVKTALLGVPTLLGIRALGKAPKVRSVDAPETIPSTGELFQRGSQAFEDAKAMDVVLNEAGATELGVRVLDNVDTPDPVLHPKSTRVVQRVVEDAETGSLDFEQMSRLRQIANDARTGDPADARIAGQVVREIDDLMSNLDGTKVSSGNFTEANRLVTQARDLWSRARRSEVIDEAFRKAELDAGDTGGAGFENKLRIRFRQIARNEKQMRQFTPEERALIERVAKGGAVDNTLRNIGKLAPTGVVSGGLSIGGSAAMLSPLLGPVAGPAALPLLGLLARDGATRATLRNANAVSETIRRQPAR